MKFPWLRNSGTLLALFSDHRWYRRLAGGKWEQWWVDAPVNSDLWHPVDKFTRHKEEEAACHGSINFYQPEKYWFGFRPTPLCRGTPVEENWG